MSSAISALNTLAFEGYSLSVPDWLLALGLLILLLYLPVLAFRLFKTVKEDVSNESV